MSTGAKDAAPLAPLAVLTIQLCGASTRGYDVTVAEVVQRAYAAGMSSATVRRGSARRRPAGTVPAARTGAEELPVVQGFSAGVLPSLSLGLSLADEEGLSIAITGREEEFPALVQQLRDLIGDRAVVQIESRNQVREFAALAKA